jgi:hypothetical protein
MLALIKEISPYITRYDRDLHKLHNLHRNLKKMIAATAMLMRNKKAARQMQYKHRLGFAEDGL